MHLKIVVPTFIRGTKSLLLKITASSILQDVFSIPAERKLENEQLVQKLKGCNFIFIIGSDLIDARGKVVGFAIE